MFGSCVSDGIAYRILSNKTKTIFETVNVMGTVHTHLPHASGTHSFIVYAANIETLERNRMSNYCLGKSNDESAS